MRWSLSIADCWCYCLCVGSAWVTCVLWKCLPTLCERFTSRSKPRSWRWWRSWSTATLFVFLPLNKRYCHACNTNLILILVTVFVMLSSWLKAPVHPVFLVNTDLSSRWLPTLRPSQQTWAVRLTVGCCHPHPIASFVRQWLLDHLVQTASLCG